MGARESIHQALRALACRGIAIIVVSSDLLEVNTLCHQLLVVASHQVAGRMMADAQTDAVLSMMAGAC
ncbi:L-arabinose transporter ATP-binding protein [compost metagenome]